MAATLFATNIGGKVVLGFAGWRVAFFAVALVSVVTGALVPVLARDPRGGSTTRRPSLTTAALTAELKELVALFASSDVQAVLRVRSFQIIILQGIVGTVCASVCEDCENALVAHQNMVTCALGGAPIRAAHPHNSLLLTILYFHTQMPWMSLSFLTLWLQLVGFHDSQASSLVALFTLGCAAGSLLGGHLGVCVWQLRCMLCAELRLPQYHTTTTGDRMSQAHPNSGRILTNQLSVLLGLPVSVLLLKGLPWPLLAGDVSLQWTYSCVLVLFGLVASWCVICTHFSAS